MPKGKMGWENLWRTWKIQIKISNLTLIGVLALVSLQMLYFPRKIGFRCGSDLVLSSLTLKLTMTLTLTLTSTSTPTPTLTLTAEQRGA
jgi:hypothetical protein